MHNERLNTEGKQSINYKKRLRGCFSWVSKLLRKLLTLHREKKDNGLFKKECMFCNKNKEKIDFVYLVYTRSLYTFEIDC